MVCFMFYIVISGQIPPPFLSSQASCNIIESNLQVKKCIFLNFFKGLNSLLRLCLSLVDKIFKFESIFWLKQLPFSCFKIKKSGFNPDFFLHKLKSKRF